MSKYILEPFLVQENATQPREHKVHPYHRPSWLWILRVELEPLCAKYRLVLEYGDKNDESCAIFHDDLKRHV